MDETWTIVRICLITFFLGGSALCYWIADRLEAKELAEKNAAKKDKKEAKPKPKLIEEIDKSRLIDGHEKVFVYKGQAGEYVDYVIVE